MEKNTFEYNTAKEDVEIVQSEQSEENEKETSDQGPEEVENEEEENKEEVDRDFLPVVYPPYLPKKGIVESEYTLVLDLDETLIHFVNPKDELEDGGSLQLAELGDEENDFFYMIRPFCNKFLAELSKFYEIVIFTAAMQDYADWIISGIDRTGYIKHRLYRQHCGREETENNGEITSFQSIKDLRLLGRDIKKTIIIDNLKENFMSTCPNNGIEIKSWFEDLEDKELKNMIPFLKAMVLNEEKDLRPLLKYYRNNHTQYVNDFVLPDIETDQNNQRSYSTLGYQKTNRSSQSNIDFIKNRKKMRGILDALDV